MSQDIFQAIRRDGERALVALPSIADINVTDDAGLNLLHMAVAWDNVVCAAELIKRGIDVNCQDNDGQTPLHYAAEHCNATLAGMLLKHGSDMTILDSHKNSPLWTAIFNARGKYETVKVFADFDCSTALNIQNVADRTPLDFAKQIGDAFMVDLFGNLS